MAAAKRRRRFAGYYEVAGVDVEGEMARLCALPLLGGASGELAQSPPSLTVRRAWRVRGATSASRSPPSGGSR